jgi:hypothetical protein
MGNAGQQAENDGSDPWGPTLAVVRIIAGWAGTAIGALNLSMGIDTSPGTTDGPYLVFHLVLLIGGALLLAMGRLRKAPKGAAWAVGGLVAGLGLALSALPATSTVCCLRGFAVRHGFPFTMLGRNTGGWHVALGHVVADLLFWGLVGLAVLVLFTLVSPPRAVMEEDRLARACQMVCVTGSS